jgi:hypothetical protein
MWGLYLYRGKIIIPTSSRTLAGYYLETEPVAVAEVADVAQAAVFLADTMARGNPTVATPTRAKFPKPVVLGPAGAKSWRAFEKEAICVNMTREGDQFLIDVSSHDENGDWVIDPGQTRRLPGNAAAGEILQCILGEVQSRDAK